MEAELRALEAALGDPKRPVMAVVGGAKVSTKLDLLSNLVTRVDMLVIGGGMANTFLVAQGYEIGRSLCGAGPGGPRARDRRGGGGGGVRRSCCRATWWWRAS